jgi:hypothetical protein
MEKSTSFTFSKYRDTYSLRLKDYPQKLHNYIHALINYQIKLGEFTYSLFHKEIIIYPDITMAIHKI